MKPPRELRKGDVLGRYAIEALLGQGAMGRVLRARDTVLERLVALKILLPDRKSREEVLLRVLREAKMAAQITHPNTVHIYDVGEIEGVFFIAMEYVRGTTAKAYLDDPTVPVARKLRWMLDIARALAAAHSAAMLHRDVKPSNILISSDDVAKLADFGLAKRQDTTPAFRATYHTVSGTVVGTPAFMAPEQLQGKEIDARADQFSWALTTYTLLAGKNPREADPLLKGGPRMLSDISPVVPRRIAEVVNRALAEDPRLRFRSMDELVRELEAAVSARAAYTPSQTGPPPPRPPSSRPPANRGPIDDAQALASAARTRLLAGPRRELARVMSEPAFPALGDDTPSDDELLAEPWWFSTIVASCPAAPLTCASFSSDGASIVAVGAGGVATYAEGAWKPVDVGIDPTTVLCAKAIDDGSFVLAGRGGLAVRVGSDGLITNWAMYAGDSKLLSKQRPRLTFHAVDVERSNAKGIVFACEASGRAAAAFARGHRLDIVLGPEGSLHHLACGALVLACGNGGVSVITRSGMEVALELSSVALSMAALDDETFAIGGVESAISVLAPLAFRHVDEHVETSAAIVALAAASPLEAWAIDANCALFRRARRARWIGWPRAPSTRAQPIAAWAARGRLLVVAADGVVLEGRRG